MSIKIGCGKHSDYQGERAPQGACKMCWAMYHARQLAVLASAEQARPGAKD